MEQKILLTSGHIVISVVHDAVFIDSINCGTVNIIMCARNIYSYKESSNSVGNYFASRFPLTLIRNILD
ncbi:hypothetical protein HZS_1945 [Henneguya salminicola]|nr:hypothetical protein HZS_1945 [Henneguya salminicola]